MPNRIIDLRVFRYVLASAEHGSFRRAAAALNVQHPAVSRGVSALEHRLGAKLFERYYAGIRPTPAGERFIEEATLGFDHLQRAMQHVGALQRGERGKLIVGVSLPVVLLNGLFRKYRENFGGVSLEIVESTSAASWSLVRKRRLDVAFVAKCLGNEASARSLHLCDEPLAAVLPRSHPLASADSITLEQLRRERFILCSGGLGPDFEEYLSRWKMERQLYRVGQSNLINMVEMGFGLTLAVGPPSAATEGVVLVPIADSHTVPLHAIWMDSNPNPALKELLDIAKKTIST